MSAPTVVPTVAALRDRLDTARRDGRRVGFVPTMGFLHAGHVSLMEAARLHDDVVVVSIFVNPLQFAPTEDLASYPRDLDRDLGACAGAGVDVVFAPTVQEMYPEPVRTVVSVDDLSRTMEGAARPTHFAGVATVVAKLFAIVGPCRAYFGEKDFQQLAVVRRMVADLSMPVTVIGCPTVREPDGLAMSSRNVYLTPDERAAAPGLHEALEAGADAIRRGELDADAVRAAMTGVLTARVGPPDYAEIVDPDTLAPLGVLEPGREVRLLVAARVGVPRLLDNVGVVVPPRR